MAGIIFNTAVPVVNHAQVAFDRIEFEGMAFDKRYRMLNGSVIPRPIAFVTTLNEDDSINAAPFSSFMIASVEAGLLAFSVGPNPVPKRTLRNVRRRREFVINTVPEELARQVQDCSDAQEPGLAKLDAVRLHILDSERIGTPRIAESKVQFECVLHKVLNFGESHMVVGEVVLMHARSGLIREGKIDPLLYAPLGRIAGRNYCRVRELISV